MDWRFIQEQPSKDSKLVDDSLKRVEKNYGLPVSYTADRGFDSAENTLNLEELNIFNGICPKSLNGLKEKLEDQRFRLLQKRRGSTEGRIGILKNSYIGKHHSDDGIGMPFFCIFLLICLLGSRIP